ncbi:MAG: site-2 protease family protein [Aphanothece sp. CMT-3BRIN-NPC111]|jgi:Zn-dependent protease/CBS domain-containing protein|nr:site-2 protease family protein [Aphanothece sp. CMT-3BRIN-NPC111]
MQAGWRIGSLFKIPLYIHPSWLYILAIFTYINGRDLQQSFPQGELVLAWGIGFLTTILLFGSVLLHELGHSLVARSQGIKVNSITLFLFGGVASIEEESKTPGQAFQVAIAGPVVSLLLFVLLSSLMFLLPISGMVGALVSDIAHINLVLVLFNLIPGLPLDGGQVLKAGVWKLTGDRFQGVHWAAKTGKFLGWGGILLGIATFLLSASFSGLWISLIGWFVLRNAKNYDRVTTLQEALLQLMAADAMTRDFRVVDADMTLRQFADEYILKEAWASEGTKQIYPYYAASNGRYRGLVSIEDLHFVERSRWETQTIESIVRPLAEIATVQEKMPLVEVINCMETHQMKRLTVLSPAETVAGVIDRGDIVRSVASKLNLPFSEADIKNIKAEGSYPPALQLQAIAKATTP